MTRKIKLFHLYLIFSIFAFFSCEQLSEDTSPPILSEETFRILLFNDNTNQYDSIITNLGGINSDPVEAPNEIVLKGFFSDNVLLDRLEFKVTPQSPVEDDENFLYSKSTSIEDFALPILGTSTSSFKTIEIPGSVRSNTYDYLMTVYDENGNVSKDYSWSLMVKNTNPLIKINQIGTEYNTGETLNILGEISAKNSKFLKEASISFRDTLIAIDIGENQSIAEINNSITFQVSDASADLQNLVISAKDNTDKVANLVVSLLVQ
ncbi:hypothetical protein [Flexithrix dorotheae]|uniref:hypothetical protein n=1 Tax=Flexithrix dorotheae TaxID=70993 RepID=UPI00036B4BDD|nr:hypothetical protein [Flexithrix dorotheae]